MPKPTFSDAEWRRLMKVRQALQEEEEAVLAKFLRLKKQSRLLESRTGDFIARGYKEIAELEELERGEKEERERLESKQTERDAESVRAATGVSQCAVADCKILAATSEDPTLTELLNDPPLSWTDLDPSGLGEAPGSPSPVGGIVEPTVLRIVDWSL